MVAICLIIGCVTINPTIEEVETGTQLLSTECQREGHLTALYLTMRHGGFSHYRAYRILVNNKWISPDHDKFTEAFHSAFHDGLYGQFGIFYTMDSDMYDHRIGYMVYRFGKRCEMNKKISAKVVDTDHLAR